MRIEKRIFNVENTEYVIVMSKDDYVIWKKILVDAFNTQRYRGRPEYTSEEIGNLKTISLESKNGYCIRELKVEVK